MTYSGVPKAGAPGPHVDVRGERAVDHGRAGPDDLRQRHEEERLGILLGECAGQRDRAHRSGEREGRCHDRLAVQSHLHQAIAHRSVEAERRIRVDDGHQGGFAEEVVARHPSDETGDLQGVLDRAGAEPEALPGLVELDRECPVHVEVAGLDGQVVGFERAAALLVDDVDGADETDVVDEVGEVAGPPAAIQVARECRTTDGTEDEVRATESDVPLGIPGVEVEFGRCGCDQLLDMGGIEPDTAVRSVDGRARIGEGVERPVAEHLDPDLGQHPQRRPMDGLDLISRQDLDRPKRVGQPPPGELLQSGRGAPRPATRAVVRLGCGGFRLVHERMLRRIGGPRRHVLRDAVDHHLERVAILMAVSDWERSMTTGSALGRGAHNSGGRGTKG